MTNEYNPLSYDNLRRSICHEFDDQDLTPFDELESLTSLEGCGIYAIYYSGQRSEYQKIANGEKTPIYVGQTSAEAKDALFTRLRTHKKSVSNATNLKYRDFSCRYLVLDRVWTTLGELAMLEKFEPVWNTVVTGFGNHPEGKKREGGELSKWDLWHPGRPGRAHKPTRTSLNRRKAEIKAEIEQHLTK